MAGPFSLLTGLGMLFTGLAINPKPKQQPPVKPKTQREYEEELERRMFYKYRDAVEQLEKFESEPGHEYCVKMRDRFLKEAVIVDLEKRDRLGDLVGTSYLKHLTHPNYTYTPGGCWLKEYDIDNIELYARFRMAGFTYHEIPYECQKYPEYADYFDEKWYVRDGETFNDAIERMAKELGIEVLYIAMITKRYTGDASKVPGYINGFTNYVDREFLGASFV